jgi:ACR3 family arsenite transporter
MSIFERYLTVWVFLCIVAGVAFGHASPALFRAIGSLEVAKVNLPVAVLIWLMIVPMLLKIDFAALRRVGEHWRGIGVTLIINWGVKPFSMAALGWFFIGQVFRPWLPADQINSYIAGLILLAAAPCTAMVFVWSNRESRTSRSPRSRSTIRSWFSRLRRSSACCLAFRRSQCPGIR